ncbi:hypothetical protein Syun_001438 [Stephania yunnanensis]|uniref:sucrose synthase n=1 Tax=Stephania yunnanensis TaxID=152371 RepID=A0AAP0Q738_9MAGN
MPNTTRTRDIPIVPSSLSSSSRSLVWLSLALAHSSGSRLHSLVRHRHRMAFACTHSSSPLSSLEGFEGSAEIRRNDGPGTGARAQRSRTRLGDPPSSVDDLLGILDFLFQFVQFSSLPFLLLNNFLVVSNCALNMACEILQLELGNMNLRLFGSPGKLYGQAQAHLDEIMNKVAEMSGKCAKEVKVVISPYGICPLGAHIDHQITDFGISAGLENSVAMGLENGSWLVGVLYEGPKSPAKGNWSAPCRADFEPFNATFPRPTRSSSIGNAVQFLNRHLSLIMFRNKDCLEPLLDFLRAHKHKGHVMMVNDRIYSISRLQSALVKAEEFVSLLRPDTPYSEFEHKFQELGLEKGWGNDARRVLEMMHLLSEINLYFCEVLLEKEVDDDEDKEEAVVGYWSAFVWLAGLRALIALLSEYVVDVIEGLSVEFISIILLPIVGNATEHASALIFAYRNKLYISLGLSTPALIDIIHSISFGNSAPTQNAQSPTQRKELTCCNGRLPGHFANELRCGSKRQSSRHIERATESTT